MYDKFGHNAICVIDTSNKININVMKDITHVIVFKYVGKRYVFVIHSGLEL